jgi:aminoglycoside 2'-N-acetyltransferase I
VFTIRRSGTAELSAVQTRTLRHLLDQAYEGEFSQDDWQHCLGGVHVLGWLDGELVAHASVVTRRLYCADRPLRTGYVEGVAVRTDCRRKGFATAVMLEINGIIARGYELGALSDGSGIEGFYQRLGWRTWLGPTLVITANGHERTEDEDGYILVLPTEATRDLDLTQPLACEWRPGDDW